MERNVQHLVELMRKLEGVARVQDRTDGPVVQEVSAGGTVAREAARQLREMAHARGVEVRPGWAPPRVFQRFTRAHTERDDLLHVGGIGLGLSIHGRLRADDGRTDRDPLGRARGHGVRAHAAADACGGVSGSSDDSPGAERSRTRNRRPRPMFCGVRGHKWP